MPPPIPWRYRHSTEPRPGTLAPARAAFKGHLRPTPWDAQHLGYFLGYANWNYFTTPFLFEYPGVIAIEIEPWHEAGQTWRRLQVRFPPSIATHNPQQVFYFDSTALWYWPACPPADSCCRRRR